jgi:hypothetical protein
MYVVKTLVGPLIIKQRAAVIIGPFLPMAILVPLALYDLDSRKPMTLVIG